MGTRGQVLIEDTGVYLYQHYDGYSLEDEVRSALKHRQRWKDPEYLARIIFCQMIGEGLQSVILTIDNIPNIFKDEAVKGLNNLGFTGYGIGTEEHGDIEYLITVNCKNQTVSVKHHNEITKNQQFEEFIRGEANE